ncbi:methionyl-tRNA formyltransferase [bacterium]
MRLVFMGTPAFAVPSLEKLVSSSHEIVGVVTAPDRRKGRGLKIIASPVKQIALSLKLPIIQPDELKDPTFINQLQKLSADCFVIVGFKILPAEVFETPPKGSFNLHASLLPKYRGAAPIQWALIQGEHETGVTTFFLKRKVDTGDILLQDKLTINEQDNSGDLHDRLASLGADLVLKTVDLIATGKIIPKPQMGKSCPAPKITPETCMINWNKDANQIQNQVRGLAPRPGAFSFWQERRLKIYQSSVISGEMIQMQQPGTVVKADQNDLWIETGNNLLAIEICQIEGKSRMTADAFLRGYPIQAGDRFQELVKQG